MTSALDELLNAEDPVRRLDFSDSGEVEVEEEVTVEESGAPPTPLGKDDARFYLETSGYSSSYCGSSLSPPHSTTTASSSP